MPPKTSPPRELVAEIPQGDWSAIQQEVAQLRSEVDELKKTVADLQGVKTFPDSRVRQRRVKVYGLLWLLGFLPGFQHHNRNCTQGLPQLISLLSPPDAFSAEYSPRRV